MRRSNLRPTIIAFTLILMLSACGGGGTGGGGTKTTSGNTPTISQLSPTSSTVGTNPQTLTIYGTNFLSTSTVTYNGAAHTATYVSATQLTIQLSASDQASAGSFAVVVTNPPNVNSNSASFPVNNPVPRIDSLSPYQVIVGVSAQTLTINGANFVSNSTVTYNNVSHTPTILSSTQILITLSAADQGTIGVEPVVVTNPGPGGGPSNTQNFTVGYAQPVINEITPTSSLLGSAAETLTISGLNFMSTSSVSFNGQTQPATLVNSTTMTTQLTTTDQATAGNFSVQVTNPSPGGGAALNPATFSVDNPAPTVSSISPTSATADSSSATLTINGSHFLILSTVEFNGVKHSFNYISSSQITTTLNSTDLQTGGVFPVTVINAAPGGGAANANFNVKNPVPSISSLSPSSALAGATSGTLTIYGSNFVSGSTATYNGVSHAITFLSANQLAITLSATDLATSGTYAVVVTNPSPGGGRSNTVDFTVTSRSNEAPATNFTAPTWQKLGPSGINANSNSVGAIAVSGLEILAAVVDYSAVESFNGGGSWSEASREDSRSAAAGRDGAVAINPADPRYQFIFGSAGLEYSMGDGQTFRASATSLQNEWAGAGSANDIAFDLENPNIAYLAGRDAVFESTDFGATWQMLSWNFKYPSLIAVGPDETIFVGTRGFGAVSGSLSLSHDGGATWTTSQLPDGTRGTPTALSVNPADPEVVLLGVSGISNTSGSVLVSTDGGATFKVDNAGLPTKPTAGSSAAGTYVSSIQFAPAAYAGVVVVTTQDGVFISQAGGPWVDITGNGGTRNFQGAAWDSAYLYVSTNGEGVLRAQISEIISP